MIESLNKNYEESNILKEKQLKEQSKELDKLHDLVDELTIETYKLIESNTNTIKPITYLSDSNNITPISNTPSNIEDTHIL